MVELRLLRADASGVNWASTWANQISGSAGEKGGIFKLIAATVCVIGWSAPLAEGSSPRSSGVDIVECSIVRVTNVVNNNIDSNNY